MFTEHHHLPWLLVFDVVPRVIFIVMDVVKLRSVLSGYFVNNQEIMLYIDCSRITVGQWPVLHRT